VKFLPTFRRADTQHSGKIAQAIGSFSVTERLLFGIFLVIFILSGLTLLLQINERLLVSVPRAGGTHHEGVIGTPRSINPLIAVSETDRDLTTLVYSGLMRITPEGELIPDLAVDYTVSDDGLEYFFTIRGDAVFHDGEQVTADDVVFTVRKAQDPAIKSAKRSDWEGVTVEKVSEQEVRFLLPQAYAPFLFNTTLGILPEHIWSSVPAEEFPFTERNINPIGSGPYEVAQVRRNDAGIVARYTLTSFEHFTLGRPYIDRIMFSFFKNEDDLLSALQAGTIDAVNSISPHKAAALESDASVRVVHFPLPRVFGVFFNQSQAPVLASNSMRQALVTAVNRDDIIAEVFAGYATPVDSPIPANLVSFTELQSDTDQTNTPQDPTAAATAILENAGFAKNDAGVMERKTEDSVSLATLTLATNDVPELVAIAERVVAQWRAAGIDATLKVFDRNDFTQNVIRPRRYDAILFGEAIGRDLDFYPFWHSSQRTDPGLNIADYANIDVDAALTDIRTLEDSPERIEALRTFTTEVAKDAPAAFLYSPDFIYVVPKELGGIIPEYIGTPSDRFLAVYNWYLETDRVWNIFR
jgi:peptide/nickel transport system substrate-binding protein